MSGPSSPHNGNGDDFTRISGIGRNLDSRLHNAGVTTYAQLVALGPDKLAALLADAVAMSRGRIVKEDWIGQATKFAGDADDDAGAAGAATRHADDAPSRDEPEVNTTGLHYESFVVRILLHDVDGRISNTMVQHVGSGTERRWAGLDRSALLDFIVNHAAHGAAASPGARSAAPPGGAAVPPGGAAAAPNAQAPASEPTNVPATVRRDPRVPGAWEPFTVSIALDLARVEPPPKTPIRCWGVVMARPLSGEAAQMVAEGAAILSAEAPTIKLRSAGLRAGTYHLETVVRLREQQPGGGRDLAARLEGGVLVIAGPPGERAAPGPVTARAGRLRRGR